MVGVIAVRQPLRIGMSASNPGEGIPVPGPREDQSAWTRSRAASGASGTCRTLGIPFRLALPEHHTTEYLRSTLHESGHREIRTHVRMSHISICRCSVGSPYSVIVLLALYLHVRPCTYVVLMSIPDIYVRSTVYVGSYMHGTCVPGATSNWVIPGSHTNKCIAPFGYARSSSSFKKKREADFDLLGCRASAEDLPQHSAFSGLVPPTDRPLCSAVIASRNFGCVLRLLPTLLHPPGDSATTPQQLARLRPLLVPF